VRDYLAERGVRVDLDISKDKLGAKIRRAQLEKLPYMLVVGDKEVAARTVAPRSRDGKQHDPMTLEAFAARVLEEARPPLGRTRSAQATAAAAAAPVTPEASN
jgi:threonyl-tRNA synthetase